MAPRASTAEQKIARIASRAHGVVSRAELLDAGLSSDEIRYRLRTGALLREHPGVYRVGHRAPSVEAWYAAAVKACGEGAVLSGRAAAYLFGMVKGPAPKPEVTVPSARQVDGVATPRRRLCRADVTRWRGIPITAVPRTIVDIAGALPFDDLASACHQAGVRYGTRPAHVDAVLARKPNAKGAKRLRAVLHGDAPILLSRLEKQFRKLLRDNNLSLPITNRPAGSKYVDCRWPGHKLTVELDSYRYHNSRQAFEADRGREREAYARGDDFRRYTWGDVFERSATVLVELLPLLRLARSRAA